MARALPEDGKRHEVLDGELVVTPAPGRAHQAVAQAIFEERLVWRPKPDVDACEIDLVEMFGRALT